MTSSMYMWRARVAYLVISVALWVAIWPTRDDPLLNRFVVGLAILSNVLFLFVAFIAPTSDAFDLGERVGKAIGYQAGYRDGFEQGAALEKATEPRAGAALIGLDEPMPDGAKAPQS